MQKKSLSFFLMLAASSGWGLQASEMESTWGSGRTKVKLREGKEICLSRDATNTRFLTNSTKLIALAHLSNVTGESGEPASNFLIPAMRIIYEVNNSRIAKTPLKYFHLSARKKQPFLSDNQADIYISGNKSADLIKASNNFLEHIHNSYYKRTLPHPHIKACWLNNTIFLQEQVHTEDKFIHELEWSLIKIPQLIYEELTKEPHFVNNTGNINVCLFFDLLSYYDPCGEIEDRSCRRLLYNIGNLVQNGLCQRQMKKIE